MILVRKPLEHSHGYSAVLNFRKNRVPHQPVEFVSPPAIVFHVRSMSLVYANVALQKTAWSGAPRNSVHLPVHPLGARSEVRVVGAYCGFKRPSDSF